MSQPFLMYSRSNEWQNWIYMFTCFNICEDHTISSLMLKIIKPPTCNLFTGQSNIRISFLHVLLLKQVNNAVGTLAMGHYYDEDTVASVIIGAGTNASYIERSVAITKSRCLLTSELMVRFDLVKVLRNINSCLYLIYS